MPTPTELELALKPGSQLHGFTVERVETLPEIDGCAYVMRHDHAGTPLMWLANEDENKSFAIAFKTPPADDTGVFHILEHSVLCGSDRFPVKEPFVNLLKTSMQTFLNAMTFSDKTMYPVASTNEQDLLNLMDVYMDAVLRPQLYTKRAVFEQEGWHYEVDGLAEGAPKLRYNGVVFNEMKGALADPDDVVLNGLTAALFPQTAYRFESGGNPRAIPTLTYEGYCDTHARHYNLQNAHIVLYGDMSLTAELEMLDRLYLSRASEPCGAANPLELQPPVIALDARVTLTTAPENAAVALGYVIGTAHDRERVLACEVLSDALMGSNEAPLKRALLEAELGDDVDAFVYDGLLQPFFALELRGAEPGAAETFRTTVERELTRIARDGVPRTNIEAALESAAFHLRERDFGYADGVALAIGAMTGWLYDDGMPTTYLRYEEALANLRAGLNTTYWEDLVRTVFLESEHKACCELVPVPADDPCGAAAQEAAELAAATAQMTLEQLEATAAAAEELHRIQDEPDAPEALATLPQLQIGDIGAARPEPACTLVEGTPLPCLHHDIPTRRIDYTYHYFDLSRLEWEDLPYVSLACSLLGKLDTEHHSASELDTLIESRLGRLGFSTIVHEDAVTGVATPRLIVGASALAENTQYLATLPAEVWGTTRFDDVEKIRVVLNQQRLDTEQAFANAGHTFAMSRAWGYTSKNNYLAQHFGGVDYYRFVRDLLARWDVLAPELPAKLARICKLAFVADGSFHSFTGERADLARFWDYAGTLGLPEQASAARGTLSVPEPPAAGEAFVIPSDICFAAKVDDGAHCGAPYGGLWPVAAKALNYDYLWNEIRVKGGAYGCGFRAGANGNMGYYTYRDPNLDASLARMDAAAGWLAAFNPTESEMTGYIVSTVAGHDAPQRPRQIALRQDTCHLVHREAGWHERIRTEELAATPEQIRPLARHLERINERNAVCVFGGREILDRSDAGLTVIELMGDADSCDDEA